MWFILAAVAALALLYVFLRQTIIDRSPAWARFCAWVDPPIVALLSKSRQIAIARLTAFSGIAVGIMSTVGGIPIDWSMIGEWIVSFFPEASQPFVQKMILPLAIWAYGEFMRRVTTEPLAEKE